MECSTATPTRVVDIAESTILCFDNAVLHCAEETGNHDDPISWAAIGTAGHGIELGGITRTEHRPMNLTLLLGVAASGFADRVAMGPRADAFDEARDDSGGRR
jgi:hypothetical protein